MLSAQRQRRRRLPTSRFDALRPKAGSIPAPRRESALEGSGPAGSAGNGGNDNGGSTFKERLEAQERDALLETLRMADGNLTRAAELFGVPRTTYREKLVKNGLLGTGK